MNRYMIMLAVLLMVACQQVRAQGNSTPGYEGPDRPGDVRVTVLPEKDSYLDLRTGTVFQLHWDAATNTYVRNDLQPMNIYVNQNTLDTFWGSRAMVVNNAVIRDGAGYYTVDQLRLPRFKGNENGMKMKGDDGTKVKANENGIEMKDEATKIKANDNGLKAKNEQSKLKVNENGLKAKDGEDKLKANDNETKEKWSAGKAKQNEDEMKVKTDDVKVKDNGEQRKYKYDDGTKVKEDAKETKIKTEDTKTIINHETGEVKMKDR